jgi:hypothetical protein
MARDVRCPNPSCTHVFPADKIAGMAALVCPQCGGVFQVRAKKAVATAPGAAPAKPVRKRTTLLWAVAGLMILVSLALMAATIYRRTEPTKSTAPEPFRSTEHNYSFLLPGPPWQRDVELAKNLGAVLAFRRSDPNAVVVLRVRAYPKYVPSPGELGQEAVSRLRRLPLTNLQPEDKPEGAELAGRPTGRFVFQGTRDAELISGDVLFLAYQGSAYWLYRWCPADAVDRAANDFADIAGRFALLDLHPDWQPPRRTFTGPKLKYTLTAEGDRWDTAPYPPANYDPAADLALVGRERDEATDPVRQALLLVALLPAGAGDPLERAKAHLLERQKEVYEGTTLIDEPSGSENIRALKVVNTNERQRFVALRVEGQVVIWAECDYARRPVWEADFRKLLGSYKASE